MQLRGSLSQFPLIEVIQFLGMTRKFGQLLIRERTENLASVMYFDDGNLVHAVFRNDIEGVEAFELTLMKCTDGDFEFVSGVTSPKHTIEKSASFLLLECQRKIDEFKNLQEKLPPDQSIVYVNPNIEEVPPLNTLEWKILALVNGRNTIARIAQKTGDELTAKKMLLNLFNKGLISIQEHGSEWKSLVPKLISASELKIDRPDPPLLRTNLLLKAVDGVLNLFELKEKLQFRENEILQDIKLLHDTKWIKFSLQDEKTFERIKNEF